MENERKVTNGTRTSSDNIDTKTKPVRGESWLAGIRDDPLYKDDQSVDDDVVFEGEVKKSFVADSASVEDWTMSKSVDDDIVVVGRTVKSLVRADPSTRQAKGHFNSQRQKDIGIMFPFIEHL